MSENNSAKALGYHLLLFVLVYTFIRWFYGGPRTFLKVFLFNLWIIASWYLGFADDPVYGYGPGCASSIVFIILFVPIMFYTTFVWQGYCWSEEEVFENGEETVH